MHPTSLDISTIPTRTLTIHVTGVDRFTSRIKAVSALLRLARWIAPAPLKIEIEFPDPLPEVRPPQDL